MKREIVLLGIAIITITCGLIVYDLTKPEPIPVDPIVPIEPDPIPDPESDPDPEPQPEPEPQPKPANVTIIRKRIGLALAGHWFFLKIKVNNTGDLSAYNTTITVNVNFTTKYEEATIYLRDDMGILKDATVRGSLVVPVIEPGVSAYIIPLEFLLGTRWTESPILYITQRGYSFHIISDDITIERYRVGGHHSNCSK